MAEFEDILTQLETQIPQWDQARHDTALLSDIRRAFHTFKGSGRMLGRLALGDYAWAHEDMLNQVLVDELPRNDQLAQLLKRSLTFLSGHKNFFLYSIQSEAFSQAEITAVEQFVASPDAASEAPESTSDLEAAGAVAANSARIDDSEDNRIILAMFQEEVPERLQTIDQLMQELSAAVAAEDANKPELWQALERELHTLKGGARMAQLSRMADTAHEAEELLISSGLAGRQRTLPDIEALQEKIDLISTLADEQVLSDVTVLNQTDETLVSTKVSAELSGSSTEENTAGLFATPVPLTDSKTYGSYLEQLLSEQSAALPDISVLSDIDHTAQQPAAAGLEDEDSAPLLAQEQVRLSASYLDTLIEDANSLNIEQHTLSERLHALGEDVGEFGRIAVRLKQLLRSLELETDAQVNTGYRQQVVKQSSTAKRGKGGKRGESSDAGHFDPLEMDKYSEIQRLSRALAESLNDLVNIEGDLNAQLRGAGKFIKQSLYNSRGLYHDLLATRLVEVSVLAPRLRRILRQTAAELGQKVTLELEGEALKLDRHLLQRMTAPIEHLLRNAVSHGIERPEERVLLDKVVTGKVTLSVYREDNEIVFCIRDDGRGLDSTRILEHARALGMVAAGAHLTEQEIRRLILRPGFSTAEELNQISGRGVGMDVVNSEVKALGGHLLIDSTLDAGTTFTIRLPFAMASNPVLFVAIKDQSYALPLSTIKGLNRINGKELKRHLGQPDAQLSFNDEVYPVHYLGAALGEDAELSVGDDTIYPLVYTRVGGERMAWVVDAIQGRRDVILQSLGAMFKNCHFYASATITPEGQVVMVPDTLELTKRMLTAPESLRAHSNNKRQASAVKGPQPPRILVVDDSITVRKVTEQFLLHEGFTVETARDGLEALEKMDAFRPDLLLLDIEMPRMDGFELLGVLRTHERWHSVPVIMISSRTAEKHRSHATELGANDFLGKPYQNQALLAHIKKYLVQDGVHRWISKTGESMVEHSNKSNKSEETSA